MTLTPSIIDIEASGFGTDSYPIEVGFACGNGDRYCTLIKPPEDWQFWDDSAELIHHISRETLMTVGIGIDEVTTKLNEMLAGQTLYSDGWVVDKPWINTLFQRAKVPMKFSVSPIEMILKEEQMDLWDTTKQLVIKELNLTRHRASNDALIIQETFQRTLAMISSTSE